MSSCSSSNWACVCGKGKIGKKIDSSTEYYLLNLREAYPQGSCAIPWESVLASQSEDHYVYDTDDNDDERDKIKIFPVDKGDDVTLNSRVIIQRTKDNYTLNPFNDRKDSGVRYSAVKSKDVYDNSQYQWVIVPIEASDFTDSVSNADDFCLTGTGDDREDPVLREGVPFYLKWNKKDLYMIEYKSDYDYSVSINDLSENDKEPRKNMWMLVAADNWKEDTADCEDYEESCDVGEDEKCGGVVCEDDEECKQVEDKDGNKNCKCVKKEKPPAPPEEKKIIHFLEEYPWVLLILIAILIIVIIVVMYIVFFMPKAKPTKGIEIPGIKEYTVADAMSSYIV